MAIAERMTNRGNTRHPRHLATAAATARNVRQVAQTHRTAKLGSGTHLRNSRRERKREEQVQNSNGPDTSPAHKRQAIPIAHAPQRDDNEMPTCQAQLGEGIFRERFVGTTRTHACTHARHNCFQENLVRHFAGTHVTTVHARKRNPRCISNLQYHAILHSHNASCSAT